MKKAFAKLEKVSCNFYPSFLIYSNFYSNVVKKEVELAEIDSNDTVLNIGCGAIPCTAIHVAKLSGANVIALDRDEEAVRRARHSLNKFGLDDKIKIIYADGSLNIPNDFTVAMVALQVDKKEEVLKNLQQKAKPGARAIFRQPVKEYRLEYGYLSKKYPPDAKVSQKMKTFKDSYLYKLQ
ncbi:SAM-dependent methyltransferase [Natranaerobius trueperi]|uniref:Methyltransferase domain-containing protein n=1 Tax=Natranaerobius trueperi TaxID=759412 RepID=A0A226BZK5_9FIRM|nr:methyltransferase domain-containing protein [Natranaerobius trueperi]OWZ83527.1 hypothetical protein CDO51_07930 [Natranaerobius trueperi]